MRGLLVCLALAAGCVRSDSVQCGFGTCGAGLACDEVNRECVLPDQLTSCIDMPDATPCMIGDQPTGVCKGGICIRERCGDGLVTQAETCDGTEDIPARGTCIDFAYDYGVLGCTSICSESTTGCHTLGWKFNSAPGVGGIGGIWEDGDNVWVASQRGVLRYDGTQWIEPTPATEFWVHDIWAGGGHVFAVGQRGSPVEGVLAHFDGNQWTERVFPLKPMYSVFGRAPNDVYAVGRDGQNGAVYHFTSDWVQETIPTTGILRAVWAMPGVVIAVGHGGSGVAKVLSSGWSLTGAPEPNINLLGIWGSAPNNIYIVGEDVTDTQKPTGVIYHFTNNGPPALVRSSEHPVMSITGRSPREVYASGASGTLLFFDGISWHSMSSGTSYGLAAIHAGTRKVYAAYQPTYFLEWEGAAWIEPAYPSPDAIIHDIWGKDLGFLVAVSDGEIYEHDENNASTAGWQPANRGCLPSYLFATWGTDRTNVYAAGAYGHVLHRDGSGLWTCIAPYATQDAWTWDIWGSGANDVFVAGAIGNSQEPRLAHYNGSTWQDWSSQVAPHLKAIRGVWGSAANNVFLVGDGGVILRYNGSTFTPMASGTTDDLKAVWGSGATDVFAVGANGTILHFDGTAWTSHVVPAGFSIPTDGTLQAVAGTGPNNVFALGGRTLMHYDGTHWAPVNRLDSAAGNAILILENQVILAHDDGLGARLIGTLLP